MYFKLSQWSNSTGKMASEEFLLNLAVIYAHTHPRQIIGFLHLINTDRVSHTYIHICIYMQMLDTEKQRAHLAGKYFVFKASVEFRFFTFRVKSSAIWRHHFTRHSLQQ